MAKKKKKRFRLLVKILLCFIYLVIGAVLVLCAYRLHEKDRKIIKWSDVSSTGEYSYIDVSQMSETFAVIKEENKQIHFVIEQDEDLEWHTYLIAIKNSDYDKYKKIIDYTYERTEEKPEKLRLYGYPVKISSNIKSLAVKNIKNFVPIENQVELTEDNFEQYLTDTYLDTTQTKKENLNYIVITLLLMAFVLLILIIVTLFDKDKIVDEVDNILEKEIKEIEKKKDKKKKKVKNKKTKKKVKKTSKQNKNDDIEII